MRPLALLLLGGVLCTGVESLDVHFPHEGVGGWTVLVALSVVIAAVVYKKRNEISGMLGNDALRENEQLKRENAQLKDRLAKANATVSQRRKVESQNRDLQEQLEAVRSSSVQMEDTVRQLETSQRESRDLATKVQSQGEEIKRLKSSLESTKRTSEAEGQQLKREVEEAKRSAEASRREVAAAKREAEELKKSGERAQLELETTKRHVEALSAELASAKEEAERTRKGAEVASKDLEKARRDLEAARAESEVSKRILESSSQATSQLRELEEQRRMAEQQLKALAQEKEKSNEENLKLKQQLQANTGTLEKELEQVKRSMKEKEAAWGAKLEESKKKLESVEKIRLKELQDSQEEVEAAKAETKKMQKLLEEISTALEDEKNRRSELAKTLEQAIDVPEAGNSGESQQGTTQEAEDEELDLAMFKVKKEVQHSPRRSQPAVEPVSGVDLADLAASFKGTEEDVANGSSSELDTDLKFEGLDDLSQSLNLPDEIEDANFLEAFKRPKKTPSRLSFEEPKAETPEEKAEVVDDNSFMQPRKKTSMGGRKMKGIDLSALREELKESGESLDVGSGKNGVLDPNSDVNRGSKKKTRAVKDVFPSGGERKLPAFMDIFQSSTQESPVKSKVEITKETGSRSWAPGEPIVEDYSVKEDINKKGKRKAKKKVQYWQVGGKLEMEDQHLIDYPFANDPKKALFCIFDGHAGKSCAEAATVHFPKELGKRIFALTSPVTDISEVFRETYLSVDELLKEFEYEGCTSTTVYIWEDGDSRYLQCANVGDSTAFLLRGNETVWLSKDHKPTSKEERNRMSMAGLEIGENQTRVGGLAVSRALGDHFLKQEKLGVIAEPFISEPFRLESTDSLLILASDGLWDVMTGEKAMSICSGLQDAESMARRLLQTALAEPKCSDNITIMVVKL